MAAEHSSQLMKTVSNKPPLKWVTLSLLRLKQWFPGWQLTVVVGGLLAFVSLVLNVVFLAVAVSRHGPGTNGLGLVYSGSCNSVDWWNRVAKAVINVASTLLVQQSNACMQMLASPTRAEVDKAHGRHEWVDVGIQSFRNVWKRSIDLRRVQVWWVLAISTTFLHLLWNSIIITSPRSFQYIQLAVTDRFLTNATSFSASADVPILQYGEEGGEFYPDNLNLVQQSLNDTTMWEYLNNSRCLQEYAQPFVSGRSDVVVVVGPTTTGGIGPTIIGAASAGWGPWPYQWICDKESFSCSEQFLSSPQGWTVTYQNTQWPVSHCLSKTLEEECTLEYGYIVAILVICSNLIKLGGFWATYRLLPKNQSTGDEMQSQVLLNTGDAIASFLRKEDQATAGMCLAEKVDFENGIWSIRWVQIQAMPWTKRDSKAWFRAIGLHRWVSFLLLLVVVFLTPAIFVLGNVSYYRSVGLSARSIWELGSGKPLGQFLFGSWSGGNNRSRIAVVRDVCLANLPQLILSITQFWWTSQLQCMLAAREYDKFSAPHEDNGEKETLLAIGQGRHLCVTDPMEGTEQREASMPIRYRALTLALWTLVPWLASQAIFFAKIDVLDHWMYPTSWSISQVGYSVLGLICFSIASFIAFLMAFGFGARRLSNQVPLAGTCSAAISAACHPSRHPSRPDEEHCRKRVQWGVDSPTMSEELSGEGNQTAIGRCTFTSDNVTYPVEGQLYA